ncbi:hypothetical protein N8I77_005597 [Diaporthe amygdali]|uniref:Protein kinase domain-containing protein n=1 Tax=Phomopsis amygdali TaxID=1214568 RepID=A0AAD9SG01_PHOAM|nr:hypothetical protein N8I77_005597 [Diaporthe amygdali]
MKTSRDSVRPVYVPYDYDEGAENIEDYKPGGLHPTHLGDLLGRDGRYRVVHKLGHGGFGTVWLCQDLEQNGWRAVKILAATHSTGHCADLRICEMLSSLSPQEKDVHISHVVVPIDHFWHEGPNGNHLCVVMPILGPNLEDVARRYQHQEEPLKKICYQLVLAMKFLHDKGICHGDFRPTNICFILDGLDNLEEDDLLRVFGRPKLLCLVDDGEFDWHSDFEGDKVENSSRENPEGVDEETDEVNSSTRIVDENDQDGDDDHQPRYIVVAPCLGEASKYVSDDIAVIDFGESFLVSDAPEATGIPLAYRAPEGFFQDCGTFGVGSDIWALGCSIFEVRNRGQPFLDGTLWSFLSHWEDLSGTLPEPYRSSLAKQSDVPKDPSQWVSLSEEEREERISEHMARTGVPGSLHNLLLLEHRFTVPLAKGEAQPPAPPPTPSTRALIHARAGRKVVAFEMSKNEALQLMDLFKKMFAWKPEDRSTTAEILNHPWFTICRQEKGPR